MLGVVRQLTHATAFARFVSLLERFDRRSPHLLRVLTYHRVADPETRPDLYPSIVSAAPDQFARQMEFLAARYRVISIAELDAAGRGECRLPPRAVLITFDDAYRDFAEAAWPTLRRLGLPVTLFVPTAYPDHPERAFWWDRLHRAVHHAPGSEPLESPVGPLDVSTKEARARAVKRLANYVKSLPHQQAMEAVDQICEALHAPPATNDVLGWDELKRLAGEGVTLGAHTRTHPLMNRMSLDEARDEALGSLDDLRDRIGLQPPVLAYPAGGCTPQLARMIEQAGFRFAFTTRRGINDLRTADRCLLRRINVGRGTSDAALRAQLLPWMTLANSWLA